MKLSMIGLLFALALPLSAAPLTILIEGVHSSEGKIMLALHSSEKTWMNHKAKPKSPHMVAARKGTVRLTIDYLEPGTYAVAIYHDENSNRKLDKNGIGIPKEGYAFSNNARGAMGPPSYEKASFKLGADGKTITVKIVY